MVEEFHAVVVVGFQKEPGGREYCRGSVFETGLSVGAVRLGRCSLVCAPWKTKRGMGFEI